MTTNTPQTQTQLTP